MFAEEISQDIILELHERWKNDLNARNDIVRKIYYMMPQAIEWITDVCMLRGSTFIASHMRQMLKLFSILDSKNPRLSKKEIFEYHFLLTKDLTELEIQANIYMYFHKAVTNYFSKRKPKSQITKYVEKHIMYMFRDWFRVNVTKLRKDIVLLRYDEDMLYCNSIDPDAFVPDGCIVAYDWSLYSGVDEPNVEEKSKISRILAGETIREIKELQTR